MPRLGRGDTGRSSSGQTVVNIDRDDAVADRDDVARRGGSLVAGVSRRAPFVVSLAGFVVRLLAVVLSLTTMIVHRVVVALSLTTMVVRLAAIVVSLAGLVTSGTGSKASETDSAARESPRPHPGLRRAVR